MEFQFVISLIKRKNQTRIRTLKKVNRGPGVVIFKNMEYETSVMSYTDVGEGGEGVAHLYIKFVSQ